MRHASPDSRPQRSAATPVRIVHRTRERLRLRIPARRHDLAFFLDLYDDLRGQPEIDEISINPATGSVLVWFDPDNADRIDQALMRGGRLQIAVCTPGNRQSCERHDFQVAINDMRILVFMIMAVLSVHQLMKGQFLAPVLTMLLYIADLVTGIHLEHQAAATLQRSDIGPRSAAHDKPDSGE